MIVPPASRRPLHPRPNSISPLGHACAVMVAKSAVQHRMATFTPRPNSTASLARTRSGTPHHRRPSTFLCPQHRQHLRQHRRKRIPPAEVRDQLLPGRSICRQACLSHYGLGCCHMLKQMRPKLCQGVPWLVLLDHPKVGVEVVAVGMGQVKSEAAAGAGAVLLVEIQPERSEQLERVLSVFSYGGLESRSTKRPRSQSPCVCVWLLVLQQ
mmetsp:Transcript_45413/g.119269  ORF Transcript_45413/g.119269 Transcript_45413/m.119269 type:complete len:211 (+) Transcript_45413:1178-1810(+)